MLAADPKIPTFFGLSDVLLLFLGHFTTLLPYIHFERDLAALPYMTRDYIKMKYEERRRA